MTAPVEDWARAAERRGFTVRRGEVTITAARGAERWWVMLNGYGGVALARRWDGDRVVAVFPSLRRMLDAWRADHGWR